MSGLLHSLTESELMLVRETDVARLSDLDEDDLMALHERVRRARNKYTKSYRREASAKVAEHGGRGIARPTNSRNREKAEVFEDALARVSRGLARAARESARRLRSERITTARLGRGAHSTTTAPRAAPRAAAPRAAAPRAAPVRRSQRARPEVSSRPEVRQRQAASRAKGRRRQAGLDTR
jgi:hypothetical protein